MNDMNFVYLKVPMTKDEFKCWRTACLKSDGFAYNYLRKIIFERIEKDFGIVPTERWEYPASKIENKRNKLNSGKNAKTESKI